MVKQSLVLTSPTASSLTKPALRGGITESGQGGRPGKALRGGCGRVEASPLRVRQRLTGACDGELDLAWTAWVWTCPPSSQHLPCCELGRLSHRVGSGRRPGCTVAFILLLGYEHRSARKTQAGECCVDVGLYYKHHIVMRDKRGRCAEAQLLKPPVTVACAFWQLDGGRGGTPWFLGVKGRSTLQTKGL